MKRESFNYKSALYLTLVVAIMVAAAMLYKAAATEAVYVEIDGRFALSANRLGNIVSCVGYDEEARELLGGMKNDGKDYLDAISDITSRLKLKKLLNERDSVKFEISTEKGATHDERLDVVKNNIGVVARNHNINAVCAETDRGIESAAHEYGISVARYRMICEMQKAQPDISMDVYKDYSLKTLNELYEHIILSGETKEAAEEESGAASGGAVKEKINEILSESRKGE